MRKMLVIVFFVMLNLVQHRVLAQEPYQLTFGTGGSLAFDDTSTTKYFYIDTTIATNIWQVGSPDKIIFDSAYSAPRAMVTDTVNYYPVNNYSTFYMTLLRAEGFMWFEFRHKFDTDTLSDGGMVQMSFDMGDTWGNVIDESFLSTYNMSVYGTNNFYTTYDTIQSLANAPGFSGNSNGWMHSTFGIFYQNSFNSQDTFLLRFVFASDSVNTDKEGWIIDDIYLGANHIGIEEGDDEAINFTLYPNPASTTLTIESAVNSPQTVVSIYNAHGQEVLLPIAIGTTLNIKHQTLNISSLSPGLYYLHLQSAEGVGVKKFEVIR